PDDRFAPVRCAGPARAVAAGGTASIASARQISAHVERFNFQERPGIDSSRLHERRAFAPTLSTRPKQQYYCGTRGSYARCSRYARVLYTNSVSSCRLGGSLIDERTQEWRSVF